MSILVPVPPFNINWMDKLPEDIKTNVIAYAKLSQEKGIVPLLKSNLGDFEKNFAQAGRYVYNYVIQVASIIKYQNQDDIMSGITESFFDDLNEVRKEISGFRDELMFDSIDVIQNFIKVSNMSTYALDPTYYTMAFEGFVNVSVCLSALWIDKTGEEHLKPEIKSLLVQKFEDNTDILNNLVQKIQIGEDKKAVMEGRHEYAEGKTRKFNTIDEIQRALESS